MTIQMLKGKIHRAKVVQAELNYVGSITVDPVLMEAAGIYEYEKVQIVDVENGSRFETYTIAGEPGSGMICLNGAAARMVQVEDHIIIMSYCDLTPEEAFGHKPKVVFVDDKTRLNVYLLMKNMVSCLTKKGDFMLQGKTIVLGVTGSIAAYKIANLTSMLTKLHADVHVLMTQNATNFINPITFETLTNHKCLVDTFDRNFNYNIEHVSLGNKADLVLVAPASANIIAKMANGIADDMLSTTLLACRCKKLVAPAMNTNMYENPITQANLQKLRDFGMEVIEPATGLLACKAVGKGKMPSEEVLLSHILQEIQYEHDMEGKRVLITAGPTRGRLTRCVI